MNIRLSNGSVGKTFATTWPFGATSRLGGCGRPVSRMSWSVPFSSCRLRRTGEGPDSQSSPIRGESRGMPLASAARSAQAGAAARVSSMSSSMSAMRPGTSRSTHAFACSFSEATAASSSAVGVGGMEACASGMAIVPTLVTGALSSSQVLSCPGAYGRADDRSGRAGTSAYRHGEARVRRRCPSRPPRSGAAARRRRPRRGRARRADHAGRAVRRRRPAPRGRSPPSRAGGRW
jgi:hypothetical protein